MKRLVFAVPFLAAGLAVGQDLPEGDGKKLVQEVCSGCHGLDIVVSQRTDKTGWQQIVDYMVQRGASAKDDEIAKMVDYLAKNYPKDKK
jgi:mono/diheme cytochrome c family protein